MSKECDEIGIPGHLHQGERRKINLFKQDELLYRRFYVDPPKSTWLKNAKLSAAVFKLDNDSYNRSYFCNYPLDVLYNIKAKSKTDHFFNWGILKINVNSIEDNVFIVNDKDIEVHFEINHEPLKCMYPHSEIKTNIVTQTSNSVSKATRASIRDYLIDKCEVIKNPR